MTMTKTFRYGNLIHKYLRSSDHSFQKYFLSDASRTFGNYVVAIKKQRKKAPRNYDLEAGTEQEKFRVSVAAIQTWLIYAAGITSKMFSV